MLNMAYECCREYRHEFIMPEHLLLALIEDFNFNAALNIFYSPYQLESQIKDYLESVESLPEGAEYVPEASEQMSRVIELAVQNVASSSAERGFEQCRSIGHSTSYESNPCTGGFLGGLFSKGLSLWKRS